MKHSGADSRAPTATQASPDGPPRQLGQYQIIRALGRGGMGMVFEASHLLLRQRAALKVMHPHFAHDPRFVARFRREMAALGQTPAHPNLVRAQYAGEENGVLYLAMDFVEGEDLGRLLHRRGPLAPAEACEAVRQAALGLEAVHRAGMVHRDLKPANLVLTRDGVVKILDLGLARLREPEPSEEELTPTNAQLGTFDYQAPEQADDPRRVDIRADVYSLGCTLFTLLAGRPPFADSRSPARKIHAHAHHDFPALGAGTPDGLAAVLGRMTAKRPEDRYAAPQEAAEALAPFAGSVPLSGLLGGPPAPGPALHDAPTLDRRQSPTPETTVSPLPLPLETPRKPRPPRAPIVIVLAACVLAAAAAGLYALFGPPRPRGEGRPAVPADLILAAGAVPRALDGLTPFTVHGLLDRAPVQAYWDAADGTAARAYDPTRKQLVVHSPGQALFHLGAIAAPSFTLQAQIQQAHWAPGAGVYFGYHDEPAASPPAAVFQYLQFTERTDVAGKPFAVLRRGLCRITEENGGKSFNWNNEAAEDIDAPLQEAWLIVEVVNHRLFKVRVNGTELKRLAAPAANKAFAAADYAGNIGLFATADSCVFHQATLQVLPGL